MRRDPLETLLAALPTQQTHALSNIGNAASEQETEKIEKKDSSQKQERAFQVLGR
jgi:hypothetical protein